MRTRFLLTFIVVLGLAACVAVQRTDEQGNVVLDEQGDAVVDHKIDADAAAGAAVAVAPFIAGPWGAAIPILGSLLVAFTRKGK